MSETGANASSQPGEEGPVPSYPGKGFRIGEYTIMDTLGHGSMATVFLARDTTGHEVALKIFQEGPGVSQTLLERFKREAEASKKLRKHPNIMKVYATGKEGPYHYIVMEPIKNSRTLEDHLESSALGVHAITGIIIKIARALHYAHSRHIVHRDVKPSNIMMDEFGEPLLTDFGVAALIDLPSFTMSGALTGTPLYMSPEQARAERVGPASDVYSLGVVLYEALTRVLPYSTQHAAPVKNVLEAVKTEIPRRPRFYRKDISPDLEAVILKALEKRPEDRYEDAEALAVDLERAVSGRHVSAQLFSNWGHLASFLRRYDQMITALCVMTLLIGVSLFYFRHQLLQERYEKLINLAQLRNFTSRAGATEEASLSRTPDAWYAIRNARRMMGSENWAAASSEFRGAMALSQENGDARTAAIAALELARCLTLEANFAGAEQTYRGILSNPDASPAVADFAHLELLQLALLGGDKKKALDILRLRPLPGSGPVHDAIFCLSGEMSVREFLPRIEAMPQRFHNDMHLAAALRSRLDGDEKGFASELKRCAQTSAPASEWPAPLAKYLRDTVRN